MLPRDFVDVSNILHSKEMPKTEILRLSKERDEGFVPEYFVLALRKVQMLAYEDFSEYEISKEAYYEITATINAWADEIEDGG
jgi:hypothetical protein